MMNRGIKIVGGQIMQSPFETPQESNGDKALERALSAVHDVVSQEQEKVGEEENIDTFPANENNVEADTDGEATLFLKKSVTRRLANHIANANGISYSETDTHFRFDGKYIRVTRQEVENILGKLSDAKWRMLFVNRSGNVRTFNDYEFAIGNPTANTEQTENKDYVQLNFRIERSLKEEIDTLRELMNMSQNDFVAQAVAEFVSAIKAEL